VLLALFNLLPLAVAELKRLFAERSVCDHNEVALAAGRALGSGDEPGEGALLLDYRIQHLLVDEMQDTSISQYDLLKTLTAGWTGDDGRTIFCVGDPMQSIYRFRDADVSLFMKARREGLGSVRLRPLELVENHRSAAGIVDWVNAAFSRIFPADTGSDAGLVAYRRAVSEQAQDDSAGVALHVLGDEGYAAETARVVALVRSELDSAPEQSIGILVRSRSHLAGLRSALAEAGFPAHAIEIDSLADTQLGQDLIGMTQALLHPGDRLAWFGVLRSPWCGLDWADLLALAQALGERTVIEAIADPASLTGVSEEGSERLSWIAERLGRARAMRQELPLGRWLRHCWLAIDGPATLADASGLETAERFFIDVEAYARNGDIDDPAGLREVFGEPAAGNEVPAESGIEIMTMHRAKGLEFDTVILPGLGRITRGSQSNLLLCKDFLLPDHSRLGLLAAACGTSDPLFDYLRASERADDASERGRLLYVAATRARHRLHLIGSLDAERGVPRSGSLLATLWPGLAETPVPEAGASAQTEPEPLFRQIPLRRLALEGAPPAPASIRAEPAPVRPEFEWVHPASVQVGTLIHHELQRAAEAAALTGEAVAPSADPESSRRQLALLGVEEPDLAAAARRVAEALERVWEDPVGRWILQPRKETWSELKLTINNGKQLEHIQLDRSFVDEDGVRWIIDYKTGRHLGGDVEAFLDSEVERYRDQLERYADAVAETDQRPLRVGLYFPLMANLRDWQPAAAAGR
jgi:ATP-dependent exoDNAse (exonuclease V) beta subunit